MKMFRQKTRDVRKEVEGFETKHVKENATGVEIFEV